LYESYEIISKMLLGMIRSLKWKSLHSRSNLNSHKI
jgi:hypothetical protein